MRRSKQKGSATGKFQLMEEGVNSICTLDGGGCSSLLRVGTGDNHGLRHCRRVDQFHYACHPISLDNPQHGDGSQVASTFCGVTQRKSTKESGRRDSSQFPSGEIAPVCLLGRLLEVEERSSRAELTVEAGVEFAVMAATYHSGIISLVAQAGVTPVGYRRFRLVDGSVYPSTFFAGLGKLHGISSLLAIPEVEHVSPLPAASPSPVAESTGQHLDSLRRDKSSECEGIGTHGDTLCTPPTLPMAHSSSSPLKEERSGPTHHAPSSFPVAPFSPGGTLDIWRLQSIQDQALAIGSSRDGNRCNEHYSFEDLRVTVQALVKQLRKTQTHLQEKVDSGVFSMWQQRTRYMEQVLHALVRCEHHVTESSHATSETSPPFHMVDIAEGSGGLQHFPAPIDCSDGGLEATSGRSLTRQPSLTVGEAMSVLYCVIDDPVILLASSSTGEKSEPHQGVARVLLDLHETLEAIQALGRCEEHAGVPTTLEELMGLPPAVLPSAVANSCRQFMKNHSRSALVRALDILSTTSTRAQMAGAVLMGVYEWMQWHVVAIGMVVADVDNPQGTRHFFGGPRAPLSYLVQSPIQVVSINATEGIGDNDDGVQDDSVVPNFVPLCGFQGVKRDKGVEDPVVHAFSTAAITPLEEVAATTEDASDLLTGLSLPNLPRPPLLSPSAEVAYTKHVASTPAQLFPSASLPPSSDSPCRSSPLVLPHPSTVDMIRRTVSSTSSSKSRQSVLMSAPPTGGWDPLPLDASQLTEPRATDHLFPLPSAVSSFTQPPAPRTTAGQPSRRTSFYSSCYRDDGRQSATTSSPSVMLNFYTPVLRRS